MNPKNYYTGIPESLWVYLSKCVIPREGASPFLFCGTLKGNTAGTTTVRTRPSIQITSFGWPVYPQMTRGMVAEALRHTWGCRYNYLRLGYSYMGFPGDSDSKESACNVGNPDLIPGWGRSPGEENGIHIRYKDIVLESCGQQWTLTRPLLSKGTPLECSRVSNATRLLADTALG